jgi:hypothetical protein
VGTRFAYVGVDSNDIDIKEQEKQRLANISEMLRTEVKRVVRAGRESVSRSGVPRVF